MKLLKPSISAFFTTVTVISGALLAVQPAIADSNGSMATPSGLKTSVVSRAITESEVLAAQKAWGEALVAISTTHETKGIQAAKALAKKVIDEAYGYQFGAVLFKPTLTVAPQTFRTTHAGALAYFVGGDPAFPTDKGFALNSWRKVEIKNAGIFISGNTATTMGNVMITDKNGKITTVDKTWQFFKDDSGKLRIILHHSSLPYTQK
ncbi:hypothetical protein H6F76_05135 [Leptolyngbya sp. FACHB-321]|uniref:metal-independent carbonic anhydrase n=1 Tax=Leptolyngbya sp. FACHB-321 TaxID=2692807 RepID=UPI001687C5D2|nr:hypothetical protein [Leptolyngbya sp. FACHB-321]MBD2034418.1 hypothetical protein [Leptolyngbya sp. FACHB-321]